MLGGGVSKYLGTPSTFSEGRYFLPWERGATGPQAQLRGCAAWELGIQTAPEAGWREGFREQTGYLSSPSDWDLLWGPTVILTLLCDSGAPHTES